MLFFSPRLNVEREYVRIRHIIAKAGPLLSGKESSESKSILKGLIRFLDYYVGKYHYTVHEDKLRLIEKIRSLLSEMEQKNDKHSLQWCDSGVLKLFSELNTMSSSYLLRHPEKADANNIAQVSSADRELSFEGVKQAKEFSEMIIDECLILYGEARVFIDFSYFKRTRIFAKIIEKKLKWASSKHGKKINIMMHEEDLLSGDHVKVPKGMDLDKWLPSSNAVNASRMAYDWFSSVRPGNIHSSSINIGITHLPNVAAFLTWQLRVSPKKAIDFRYADFVKQEARGFNYEGKWI